MDIIKNIEEVCAKYNLQCYISNTPIKYSKYINILNNTKIFISPYGWGEFSLKEYEYIYYGVHIVKPNMDDFEIDFSNFREFSQSSKKVDYNRKLFLDYCAKLENKILEFI